MKKMNIRYNIIVNTVKSRTFIYAMFTLIIMVTNWLPILCVIIHFLAPCKCDYIVIHEFGCLKMLPEMVHPIENPVYLCADV